MLLLTVIFAIAGCSDFKTFNSPGEFEKHLKGDYSGHLRTITENGIKVSLRYMPVEAIMVNSIRQCSTEVESMRKNGQLTEEQRTERINGLRTELLKQRETYQRSIYFELTIKYEDPSRDILYERMKRGPEEYNQWLQKLMFGLNEYVHLQSASADEIPLDLYHMERTYGIGKSISFILMFPSEFNGQRVLDAKNKRLQLHLRDFGIGTGLLVFQFELPLSEVGFKIDC